MPDNNVPENLCKNCNHTFTKQYCSDCGQKNASRITNAHLLHEVMHAVLHADKGIFPFIGRLVLSPGVMAREYINGKRKIFNPVQFLMLSVGVVILLMSFTHFYKSMELLQAQNTNPNLPAMQKKLEGFNNFINKNTNLIVFVLIPIYAFFGRFLFKKQENNYAEHLILCIFALSLSNVLTAVMLPTYYFVGLGVIATVATTFFLSFFSFCLTYKQFYQISWLKSIWKSIAIITLTMLVYLIIVMLITVFILIFT